MAIKLLLLATVSMLLNRGCVAKLGTPERRLQTQCDLSLVQLCVRNGSDGGLDMEVRLSALQVPRAGAVEQWDALTNNGAFQSMPKNGCMDIFQQVKSTEQGWWSTSATSLRLRIEEEDWRYNDVFEQTIDNICNRLQHNVTSFDINTHFGSFTAHFALTSTLIKEKIDQEWPGWSIDVDITFTDKVYQLLPNIQATAIYRQSGLRSYTGKPSVFDCDDFSYAYKGQASRFAYRNGNMLAYPVGVIFGKNSDGDGHAVNIFIDEHGKIRLLEPQNGSIIDGKYWDYTPFFVLV